MHGATESGSFTWAEEQDMIPNLLLLTRMETKELSRNVDRIQSNPGRSRDP
jgi:hypothetical protein